MERLARSGSDLEAQEFWERYRGLLFTVVGAVLGEAGRPEDAEECVQDVLWEFWRDREKWDERRGSEKTYLCVLARSRARTLRKKLRARETLPLDEELWLTAEDGAERAAVRDALRQALADLSPEERKLFTLRYVYEWPAKDIGRQLGIGQSAVTTRTHRLREKLKRLLAREGLGMSGKEDESHAVRIE